MDPMKTFLGKLLLEEITPVVMVLSTPLAEQSCRRNGLSFVEMLRPFSLCKIDVPVRTANDQPYGLQTFNLRLVYASDVGQPNNEALQENLRQLVTDAGERTINDLRDEPPELEVLLKLSESVSRPDWIQKFNKELYRSISFSEHEAFDHPVACLLVVSSNDDQPINKFVDIFNTDQLPSLLNEGAMDPKVLKHYLLLHDNQDGSLEKASKILIDMRSTFGPNDCKILCINSGQDGSDGLKENPWMLCKQQISLDQDAGYYLSADDANEIKAFMHDLTSKLIIPHMEQKIHILNQQVSATRKGFRNQIKNLWWRKGKEDTTETTNGTMYTFSSIESQIRILGDYAFILRDYDLALSNYRLLSTDYKLDKSWKRYAGVQEMMGLAYFMLDQLRKDSEYCMENAFNTYMRLGPSGLRNAARCGLWWAEMLRARGQYKDAANIYSRISNEEPSLYEAVILEQASYCYLFSNPPMLRKYGFHLVLAGNRYYISEQRQHAIRVYKNALFVYKVNDWCYIHDHVHFNIGRWYAFLGIFDMAVKHMLEVLACGRQSLMTQELFVSNFLQTAQSLGGTFEVQGLQLPTINMSSLKVIYEDQRTYATSSNVNICESSWQSLEEDLVPSMSTFKPNWLESHQGSSASKRHTDYPVSVLGEAIKVELELENPLQISISLSGISLICEQPEKSEEENIETSASDKCVEDDAEEVERASCREPKIDASLRLSELNLVLGAGESKKVQLEVTPNMEGLLKIVGIKWTLSESVVGYRYFHCSTKKKMKQGRKEHKNPLSSNLIFAVIKGLPKLEGCVHNMPQKIYAGDLRFNKLEVKNPSEYRVKNLKMAISHPQFLVPGCLEDLEVDFPNCLEKQVISEGKASLPKRIMDKSKSLSFIFPDDACIEGGRIFMWPLWFHSGHVERISLYLSLYYEMESCSGNMTYRILRMHYDLEVLPSLEVSLFVTPCPYKLQEFLVWMNIVNKTVARTVDVFQLSTSSNGWKTSALTTDVSICPSHLLAAGQAISCFFKLQELLSTSSEEVFQISDLCLGSQESERTLMDIRRNPLSNFLHYERLFQKPAQEFSGSADFILLSRMLENEDDVESEENRKVLSFNSCHSGPRDMDPISWLMDGPSMISHNFSASFCIAEFTLTVRNCCEKAVSVRIATSDIPTDATIDSANPGGWHDVSLESVTKATAVEIEDDRSRHRTCEGSPPFIWCGPCSTLVKLEPGCTAKVPLKCCVFTPGTYNILNYELHWKPESEASSSSMKRLSGTGQGHPFYVTVLPSSF